MVSEALPAVPYVPPPGLLVPLALSNSMTTSEARPVEPVSVTKGRFDGTATISW
jgi:hypothetical protein